MLSLRSPPIHWEAGALLTSYLSLVKRGWIPAAAGMTVRMACTCRNCSGPHV